MMYSRHRAATKLLIKIMIKSCCQSERQGEERKLAFENLYILLMSNMKGYLLILVMFVGVFSFISTSVCHRLFARSR